MLRILRNRWIEGVINVLAVLATAYVAVATLLAGQDVPDDSYWNAWGIPFLLRLAAIAYIGAFTFWKWLDARLEKEERGRAEASAAKLKATADLAVSCQHIAGHIVRHCAAKSTPVSIEDLATQFWVVRKDAAAGKEVIDRVVRFVLWDRPDSGVEFTKGKGVVGQAWQAQTPFALDLSGLRAQLAAGKAAFDALPPDDRLGMTYEDAVKTQSYTGIAARPLFDIDDSSKIVGLFVVDFRGASGWNCVADAVGESLPLLAILAGCQTVLKDGYGTD